MPTQSWIASTCVNKKIYLSTAFFITLAFLCSWYLMDRISGLNNSSSIKLITFEVGYYDIEIFFVGFHIFSVVSGVYAKED